MIKPLILFFLLAICSVTVFAENNAVEVGTLVSTGSIKAIFTEFRNNNGKLAVFLFNSKAGFPVKSDRAFAKKIVQVSVPQCEVVFEGIPYGTYAISAYHDENTNGKLDTTFLLGIPKEGVGCSNNPKSRFGPPSFADAKFNLDSQEVGVNIEIKYF
ncbi:MAG: DUF2141 domain-containing protein [Chlorobiaceae bacterium]